MYASRTGLSEGPRGTGDEHHGRHELHRHLVDQPPTHSATVPLRVSNAGDADCLASGSCVQLRLRYETGRAYGSWAHANRYGYQGPA